VRWLARAVAILALAAVAMAEGRAQGWILGEGANLNGVVLDRAHVGFGDRLYWSFGEGSTTSAVVSSVDLVIGGPSVAAAGQILAPQLDSLREDHGLENARYINLWVTPSWQPDWFRPGEVQRALDAGLTPVFLDWYFGDHLLRDDAEAWARTELPAYAEHAHRLGRYLGQYDGDILVVIEPELNKPSIEAWPKFGELLREHGIARIRAGVSETNAATGRRTQVFFGTTLTDNGLRSASTPDPVYQHKALGDSYGWTLSRPLLEALRPDLDFIGFQQILSQFHRLPQRPEQAVAFTAEELGMDFLPERLVNYARWLDEQLGLPILIPYVGLPTSRWDDLDGDGVVDPDEIVQMGWEEEVGAVWSRLRSVFPALHDAGVIGLAPMALFDDPIHDLGGYQHLLQNEYALGLIATDARDGVPGESFGMRLVHKRYGPESFVQLLFRER